MRRTVMASRRRIPLVLLPILLLTSAPPAIAQRCEARPGSSAVEQYCEAIPDGEGNQSAEDLADRQAPRADRGAVPPSASSALRAAGADGDQVLRLARATSPSTGSADTDSGGRRLENPAAKQDRSEADPVPGNNPIVAVKSAAQRGATVNDGFLWVLLLIAVGAAGLSWVRVRRTN